MKWRPAIHPARKPAAAAGRGQGARDGDVPQNMVFMPFCYAEARPTS